MNKTNLFWTIWSVAMLQLSISLITLYVTCQWVTTTGMWSSTASRLNGRDLGWGVDLVCNLHELLLSKSGLLVETWTVLLCFLFVLWLLALDPVLTFSTALVVSTSNTQQTSLESITFGLTNSQRRERKELSWLHQPGASFSRFCAKQDGKQDHTDSVTLYLFVSS